MAAFTTGNSLPPYFMTQTIPFQSLTDSLHPAAKYRTSFKYLGVVHIVIGVLSVTLGCLSYLPEITGEYLYVGYGIWGGILYLVLGGIGLSTSYHPKSCNVRLGLVFGTSSFLAAFSIAVVESLTAWNYGRYSFCSSNYISCDSTAFVVIHSTLAVLSMVEFFPAVTYASYCLHGCRRCNSSAHQEEIMTAPALMNINFGHLPLQAYSPPYYAQQAPQSQVIGTLQPYPMPQQQCTNLPGKQQLTESQTVAPPPYQPMQLTNLQCSTNDVLTPSTTTFNEVPPPYEPMH